MVYVLSLILIKHFEQLIYLVVSCLTSNLCRAYGRLREAWHSCNRPRAQRMNRCPAECWWSWDHGELRRMHANQSAISSWFITYRGSGDTFMDGQLISFHSCVDVLCEKRRDDARSRLDRQSMKQRAVLSTTFITRIVQTYAKRVRVLPQRRHESTTHIMRPNECGLRWKAT